MIEILAFSINAESGAWICFTGCGSGSLFTLVSEVRKCTKSESGTWILTAASDVIAYDTLLSSMPLFAKPSIYDNSIELIAQADFGLQNVETINSYFLDRGFTWNTIDEWDIRYDKNLPAIVIPIKDSTGKIVSTVRRLVPPLPSGLPKYLYTPGFKKSEYLFGIDHYQDNGMPIILVEGVLDSIWMHQNGYSTTLALMGVYCSKKQLDLLCKLTSQVILSMDNDDAGKYATEQLSKYIGSKLSVSIVGEYEGKDLQDVKPSYLDQIIRNNQYNWVTSI